METNENKKDSLGAYLKQVRESRQISLEDLAKSICIQSSVIEQIENDEWDKFPVEAYLRSYLNSIAVKLSLNKKEILERFAKESGSTYTDEFTQQTNPDLLVVKNEEKKSKVLPIIIAIILIIILGVLFYIINLGNKENISNPINPDSTEVKSLEDSAETFNSVIDGAEKIPADSIKTDSAIKADSLAELQLKQMVDSLEKSKNLPASATIFLTSASSTAKEPVQKNILSRLELTASGQESAWVGIQKTPGSEIYAKQGTLASFGAKLSYSSKDTMFVIVGNTKALASVKVNGKNIDFSRQSTTRPVRFKVINGNILFGGF